MDHFWSHFEASRRGCVPELLPKKLGKRHENDEPRGSKNCLKMGPKMDPKIIAILGCLGAPQTTSNDAPIGSENRPENHVWIPIFFVKMLAPKMNPKWLPKSSPSDHEKKTKFWCENEPRMRPKNTSKNTLKTSPKKTSKIHSNSGPQKNFLCQGTGSADVARLTEQQRVRRKARADSIWHPKMALKKR